MTKITHPHEWHYNEAICEQELEILDSNLGRYVDKWSVVRFCPVCKSLEEIKLEKE